MTAWPEASGGGGRGLVAAVAARAEGWLLEPATPRPGAVEPGADARLVVAMIGLAPRCGTTTLARALAIELAKRDRGGAALVTATSRGAAPALATAAARRLARALPFDAAGSTGRLCLVDPDDPSVRELAAGRPAPLVLDVDHGRAPEAALAMADAAVLVAAPGTEPSLADVVAASLSRADGPPRVVLNRALESGAWRGRCALGVGESRLGARLALAGRESLPALARPMAELADMLARED